MPLERGLASADHQHAERGAVDGEGRRVDRDRGPGELIAMRLRHGQCILLRGPCRPEWLVNGPPISHHKQRRQSVHLSLPDPGIVPPSPRPTP
ncbi:hypothetical protein ElP_40360 [Tautonia plasticadhaerens]|uniref:Uncharacterized protein n=1 Tax=Tautonia plasticadhaerens TaxID=2527974 RepID=A0A518H5L5_9BACT|nr:hypothetical protein ElP_40360 [Tautonia plasticadhaerens]